LDIFMLRVYDKALSGQQIQKNFYEYAAKYF
jgi:hypothetical protein